MITSKPISRGRSSPAFATTLTALALLSASRARTQGPEKHADGPLVAVPHVMSVDPSTLATGADASKLLAKGIGYFDAAMPGGVPAEFAPFPPPLPDYRMASILQGIGPAPDIDAFSIGLDWILSDGDGVMTVPPGHWGALSFSVTRGSRGEDGSVIRREHLEATGQAAGGDLFFYVLPESTVLPPFLLDRTFQIQDAADIDIDRVAGPSTPELDAHDLYVALLYANNPSLAALLPAAQLVPMAFFSVTDASKHLVPPAWWNGTTASGATVLGTTWDGVAWAVPQPFLRYDQLGLTVDEELDALAVDVVRCEMLFSTKTATRDELLWLPLAAGPCAPAPGVAPDGPIEPRIYRMPSGTPISEKAKVLRTDDVDAICALDPFGDDLQRTLLPTPRNALPWIVPPQTWASVYRVENSSGWTYTSTLVGWPQPGRQPGLVGCLIQFPMLSPWIQVSNQMRDVGSIWLGDPREFVLTLPPFHPLTGFELVFQWLVFDLASGQFDVPYATSILL